MLVLISVLYSHCSRFLETLESIPMYLYSTMIFCLSICFTCGIKLTKLNPVCVFDVVANTKRVNASVTRFQYFHDDPYLFNPLTVPLSNGSSTDQICYKNICYSVLNFVFVMSHLVTLLFSPIHEFWT